MKYGLQQVAHTGVYEHAAPTRSKGLYGYYSAQRERTMTGPARDAETHPMPGGTPIGYDARKAFLLARSVVPLRRDRKSRPIGKKR